MTEEAIEKHEDTKNSEEEQLSCDKCAFVGKTLAGLKTHKTKLHKNTPANAKKSMFTMIWRGILGEFLPPPTYLWVEVYHQN